MRTLVLVSLALLGCSKSSTSDSPPSIASTSTASTTAIIASAPLAVSSSPGGKTRTVAPFTRLKISEGLEADIDIGPSGPLQITGDDTVVAVLETNVDGDVLTIGLPRGHFQMKKSIVVRGSTPSLTSVEAASSSVVVVRGLAGDKLSVDASTASNVTLHGASKALDVTASTSAKVDAKDLHADTAKVEAATSADVSVNATSIVGGHAATASHVHVTGSPHENKIETATGAGVD